jgi:hypothetical protein
MPIMATHTARDFSDEELAGRDPHQPEDAADLAVEDLNAERGTNERLAEEADEAAREVEADEEAE